MRMWMVDPKLLCNKQLLGEALEIHMFIGVLEKGKSVDGYLRNGLFEPMSLCSRHEELVKEMKRRGYKHISDIDCDYVNQLLKSRLTPQQLRTKVDRKKALEDLKKRCIRDPKTGFETRPTDSEETPE